MRKQLCGRLWSVRNFEFLLRRLSKCWCSAQIVFSLSKKVSSVTVPGLRHSSSNMAKIPFWFWLSMMSTHKSAWKIIQNIFYKPTSLTCKTLILKANIFIFITLVLYSKMALNEMHLVIEPVWLPTTEELTYILNEVTDNCIVEILNVGPLDALQQSKG